MPDADRWFLLVIVLAAAGVAWGGWPPGGRPQLARLLAARGPRRLRPRTPADCPACRHPAPARSSLAPLGGLVVQPWPAVKSRRGAPKRIPTDGYACPCPTCPYVGITDATIHALVGDGHHGRRERIRDFTCQACGTRVSARRSTPLYRLKTPSPRVAEVLGALAEGVDVAAAVRIFGHAEGTITRWLTRAGRHAGALHERTFRELHLPHLQLDELRAGLRGQRRVVWLWVALDPLSKAVPELQLGARTQALAHALIHGLRRRLAPDCLPVFASNGLDLYGYALTAHFGQWVDGPGRGARRWQVAAGLLYGQVKKTYRRRRLVRVVPRMRWGTRPALVTGLQTLGLRGTVNTAFVERVNLLLRQSVAGLARRTWSTSQTAAGLLVHLEWWRAYYHFVRPHQALRTRLPEPVARGGWRPARRYRARTPAMALGLTHQRWTVPQLLLVPLP